MPLTTILLEYTSDPVSDSSPTYVTVSNGEFRFIEYWEGVSEEGAGFEPGGAVIRLANVNRKWEPLFSSNVIDTHQRFRLTLNGTVEGEWFITGIALEYPGNTEWSEVVVTCGDGSEVLALDNLPSLDPTESESYEDVVNFDGPWAHWRLGDPEGTQAVSQVRKVWRGKGKRRRKITRRTNQYLTASEATGVSGPAGVYEGLPLLGQDGAIIGDTDTSVLFAEAGERVRLTIDSAESFKSRNAVSVEAWVNATTWPGTLFIVQGPSAGGTAMFLLANEPAGLDGLAFRVNLGSGLVGGGVGSATATGQWIHVVGTFDGMNVRLYIDAVETVVTGAVGQLAAITPPQSMLLMDQSISDGSVRADEIAVYEHVLSPERIMAHYQAGAERGFAQQTAGERISAIATSALWSEAGIQTSGRDVLPRMMNGQPRLEEIEETMAAEGPSTLFYFEAGAPQYRGHEWRSTSSAYNTVQATFGQAEFGELPVDDLQPEYDHETFNVAQTSREGGMLVEVEDTTASGKRGRRVLDDYTGLLLTDDAEVESLANALVAAYKDPARTVPEISVSGFDDARLSKLLSLKVGHLIRVNWSGETGARNGHTANIIKRHKTLEATEALGKNGGWLLRGVYTLSRGFDATSTEWLAGIVGRSEAGVTTNAG